MSISILQSIRLTTITFQLPNIHLQNVMSNIRLEEWLNNRREALSNIRLEALSNIRFEVWSNICYNYFYIFVIYFR